MARAIQICFLGPAAFRSMRRRIVVNKAPPPPPAETQRNAVAHDPAADLHQRLAQRGERPMLDLLGQSQDAHEVDEVVGKCMELQPQDVGCNAATLFGDRDGNADA
jgi:hypothetical protein